MIYYDWMDEAWKSEENANFSVSMTPENSEECDLTFENEEEFWKFWNNNS